MKKFLDEPMSDVQKKKIKKNFTNKNKKASFQKFLKVSSNILSSPVNY